MSCCNEWELLFRQQKRKAAIEKYTCLGAGCRVPRFYFFIFQAGANRYSTRTTRHACARCQHIYKLTDIILYILYDDR